MIEGMADTFDIAHAGSQDDLRAVAALFKAYAASLDVDLAYQDFASELAGLPGKYVPPDGTLLLARNPDGLPMGCAALRRIDPDGCCEMKRLYVRPEGRGGGLGEALARAIISEATTMGYREMRLDTLPSMAAAQGLYGRLGFEIIPPYYDTAVAGTLFMRLALGAR